MVSETASAAEQLQAFGPYFALTCEADPADPTGFCPLSELYGDALAARVQTVGHRLGTEDLRVAAATFHLGLVSRLWSVSLAWAVLTGRVLDLDPHRLCWRSPPSGPMDLWLPGAVPLLPGPTAVALHHSVTTLNLRPLADAVRELCGLSSHTLHGNAASGLVGALRVLLARAPQTRGVAVPLVRELLADGPLASAGDFHTDARGALLFRRRNCCLYYRVPGGGLCGDCVLNRPADRS
ncbi:(2Fe-2S)-binding protein [Streptomyces sp. NPDC006879]|uniref:(2Fe-2S)-binding protein n=1 Tax=Streptomyces sp. NPDC006879 TaxID=3364767 RepID=UPI00367F77BD